MKAVVKNLRIERPDDAFQSEADIMTISPKVLAHIEGSPHISDRNDPGVQIFFETILKTPCSEFQQQVWDVCVRSANISSLRHQTREQRRENFVVLRASN